MPSSQASLSRLEERGTLFYYLLSCSARLDSLSSGWSLTLLVRNFSNEDPPSRRDAEAQVLGKKLSSFVTRVTSGNFHKSSGFNQETITIRG